MSPTKQRRWILWVRKKVSLWKNQQFTLGILTEKLRKFLKKFLYSNKIREIKYVLYKFYEISFEYFPRKLKKILFENGKYPKKDFFYENYLFHEFFNYLPRNFLLKIAIVHPRSFFGWARSTDMISCSLWLFMMRRGLFFCPIIYNWQRGWCKMLKQQNLSCSLTC